MTKPPDGYVARTVTKSYGSVQALKDASLSLVPGEVHALLGMNGAGKSTLVKVLAGVERPDAGTLELAGHPIAPRTAGEAEGLGISFVPQQLALYPHLDIDSNLHLGAERRRGLIIDRRQSLLETAAALEKVGVRRDPREKVGNLAIGERQLVEIAKALRAEPKVLILDEPTSALPEGDRRRLFGIIRALTDVGVAVLLVTHYLDEAFAVSARITVVRDGRVVAEGTQRDRTTFKEIVGLMTGDLDTGERTGLIQQPEMIRSRSSAAGSLKVADVTVPGALAGASLHVEPGEIVGIAGLMGSGISDLFDVIIGDTRPSIGTVTYPDGTSPRSVRSAVRSGLAFVPADRGRRGAMMRASVLENVDLARTAALRPTLTLLRSREVREEVIRRTSQLRTKLSSIEQPLWQLSGGNQQKTVFARWLSVEASVYVLDDPTCAVDVHAKTDMHRLIRDLADEGRLVVLASTDLDELVALCSRVYVMYRGRISAELAGPTLNRAHLLSAMSPDADVSAESNPASSGGRP